MGRITWLGDGCDTGAYILWLDARSDLAVAFGRFQGGRPVSVPAGAYAYVGSAMGGGATSLTGRLLRHATRTAGKPPHAIRDELPGQFRVAGMGDRPIHPPTAKRLRWHIDYLLDESAIEIAYVTIVRSAERHESALARWLASLPGALPLRSGLGASDAPGETHLFRMGSRDDMTTARENPLSTAITFD